MERDGLIFLFHNYASCLKPSNLYSFENSLSSSWTVRRLPPHRLIFGNIVLTPTVMVLRKHENAPPSESRRCDDLAWWIKLAFAYNGLYHIDNDLACGFKPPIGHSGLTRNLAKMHLSTLEVLTEAIKFSGLCFFLQAVAVEILKFGPRCIFTLLQLSKENLSSPLELPKAAGCTRQNATGLCSKWSQ